MANVQIPDPNTLCAQLAEQIRAHIEPNTALIGIHTGGAWLAHKIHELLGEKYELGFIDVAFYRDDYAARGLQNNAKRSQIGFEIAQRPVILIDDVLYTGRTTRAAINELFDYGRPSRIELAVLVDRGGRELPIFARYCAHTMATPLIKDQSLRLIQNPDDSFSMRLTDA